MRRTAIGFDEPKLMTLLTMSPGSNPKVQRSACCFASVRGRPLAPPPSSSRWASHGTTRSGRSLRSLSRNSSSLMPQSFFSATRSQPSSGPRMKSTMLSMPKLGATWPTKPMLILMLPDPASRSISWRHFMPISRVSS